MEEELDSLQDGEAVRVHAGFPNPAADRLGNRRSLALDFNQLLMRHPRSTYIFRIAGNSWTEQGVLNGDIAVIDRALTPRPADPVICWQNDAFQICFYKELPEGETIWGVITAVIHQFSAEVRPCAK
jgi:SOS-response transcriptional repressor LexA